MIGVAFADSIRMTLKKRHLGPFEISTAKRIAIGAIATGAFATGARSIGALAVGVFAVGRFAIGRLAIRKIRIQTLEVDDLRISESPLAKAPLPKAGFYVTHFLTVSDIKRSARFYSDILGGEVVLEGKPTVVKLANSWVILNVGGGPTDDKPDVILRPPTTSRQVSSFLNLRVSDIDRYYREWKRKGAEFLTEPKDHKRELRCYLKDPDGYLIEIGQSTGIAEELQRAA
jgi:catechol 2,3-dioxygenase-like lactoylglutathione lyase family enzyme